MSRRGRVRREGLGIAEVVRDVNELEGIHHREGLGLAAVDLDGEDSPAPSHLSAGQIVLRMGGQPRVQNPAHPPALLEEARELQGAVVHALDPQAHRLQPLREHPGVEGRQRGSGVPHEVLDWAVDEVHWSEHGTTESTALAVDVLGRRIDDDVRPVLQWLRENGRPEDVVHDDLGASGMGQLAHGSDVDQFHHRVARGLEEDGGRGHRKGRTPLVEIGAVDQDGFDPETRQDLVDDDVTGAEERPGRHEAVSPSTEPSECQPDSRHSGGRGIGRLGSLDEAQPLLEHRDRGIAVPAVDEVLDLVLEGGLGLFSGLVDEARGHEQRFGCLVEVAAGQAPSHGEGVRSPGAVTHRSQPCFHGRSEFFHPETQRCPASSWGPSKPSRMLWAGPRPAAVAAAAAAWERTPERHRK